MMLRVRFMLTVMIATMTLQSAQAASAVACNFAGQPPMLLITRGGMGAANNTLHIAGHSRAYELSIGSSLMTATVSGRDYVFSLREPASVTIGAKTLSGKCVGAPV